MQQLVEVKIEPKPETTENGQVDRYRNALQDFQLNVAEPMVLLQDIRTLAPPAPEINLSTTSTVTAPAGDETIPNFMDPIHPTVHDDLATSQLRYNSILREHEIERMEFDREIYRRKLHLLEIQIHKANLEVELLMKNDGLRVGAAADGGNEDNV